MFHYIEMNFHSVTTISNEKFSIYERTISPEIIYWRIQWFISKCWKINPYGFWLFNSLQRIFFCCPFGCVESELQCCRQCSRKLCTVSIQSFRSNLLLIFFSLVVMEGIESNWNIISTVCKYVWSIKDVFHTGRDYVFRYVDIEIVSHWLQLIETAYYLCFLPRLYKLNQLDHVKQKKAN